MSKKIEEKKECKKSGKFLAYALTGLAVGAAVYYLFGTKEGRKTLDKTLKNVDSLKKSFQKQAEEGLERAAKFANKAKAEYYKVLDLAEDVSHEAVEKAKKYKEEGKSLASKGLKYAETLAKEGQKKLEDA
ncbi:YtxH domain-containing protein [Olivibacter sitiensis]|uniref:YtxH domain-containing protein n=1 Tax=Olivibacter sitiensis TaxID=376470 RepID=UPI000410AA64|nr:YtxH domain-containing protein [Olivibacter sitiensis]